MEIIKFSEMSLLKSNSSLLTNSLYETSIPILAKLEEDYENYRITTEDLLLFIKDDLLKDDYVTKDILQEKISEVLNKLGIYIDNPKLQAFILSLNLDQYATKEDLGNLNFENNPNYTLIEAYTSTLFAIAPVLNYKNIEKDIPEGWQNDIYNLLGYIWKITARKTSTGYYKWEDGSVWSTAQCFGVISDLGEDSQTLNLLYLNTTLPPEIVCTQAFALSISVLEATEIFKSLDYITKTIGNETFKYYNHPNGVNEQLPYEYICTAYNNDGIWGNYSIPILWAHYGKNGLDGDGLEYNFLRTTSNIRPSLPHYTISSTVYLSKDFILPGWTDNPTGVDAASRWEWVIIRKCKNGVWQLFSTPALWAYYSKDSKDVSNLIYYATIYKVSEQKPETPIKGSFDFNIGKLTAPEGWSTKAPEEGILWASYKHFYQDYSNAESWSDPIRVIRNSGELLNEVNSIQTFNVILYKAFDTIPTLSMIPNDINIEIDWDNYLITNIENNFGWSTELPSSGNIYKIVCNYLEDGSHTSWQGPYKYINIDSVLLSAANKSEEVFNIAKLGITDSINELSDLLNSVQSDQSNINTSVNTALNKINQVELGVNLKINTVEGKLLSYANKTELNNGLESLRGSLQTIANDTINNEVYNFIMKEVESFSVFSDTTSSSRSLNRGTKYYIIIKCDGDVSINIEGTSIWIPIQSGYELYQEGIDTYTINIKVTNKLTNDRGYIYIKTPDIIKLSNLELTTDSITALIIEEINNPTSEIGQAINLAIVSLEPGQIQAWVSEYVLNILEGFDEEAYSKLNLKVNSIESEVVNLKTTLSELNQNYSTIKLDINSIVNKVVDNLYITIQTINKLPVGYSTTIGLNYTECKTYKVYSLTNVESLSATWKLYYNDNPGIIISTGDLNSAPITINKNATLVLTINKENINVIIAGQIINRLAERIINNTSILDTVVSYENGQFLIGGHTITPTEISSLVTLIGEDGKSVLTSSIVLAINNGESSVEISADKFIITAEMIADAIAASSLNINNNTYINSDGSISIANNSSVFKNDGNGHIGNGLISWYTDALINDDGTPILDVLGEPVLTSKKYILQSEGYIPATNTGTYPIGNTQTSLLVKGIINAEAGKVGGWTIAKDYLYNVQNGSGLTMVLNPTDGIRNYSGTKTPYWWLKADGSGYLASGVINWNLNGRLIINGRSKNNPTTYNTSGIVIDPTTNKITLGSDVEISYESMNSNTKEAINKIINNNSTLLELSESDKYSFLNTMLATSSDKVKYYVTSVSVDNIEDIDNSEWLDTVQQVLEIGNAYMQENKVSIYKVWIIYTEENIYDSIIINNNIIPFKLFFSQYGDNLKTFITENQIITKDLIVESGVFDTINVSTINGYDVTKLFCGEAEITPASYNGWRIENNRIYNFGGPDNINSTKLGTYIGALDGILHKTATDYIKLSNGKLEASNVDLKGKIVATSGKIGDWGIEETTGYLQYKYTGGSYIDDEYIGNPVAASSAIERLGRDGLLLVLWTDTEDEIRLFEGITNLNNGYLLIFTKIFDRTVTPTKFGDSFYGEYDISEIKLSLKDGINYYSNHQTVFTDYSNSENDFTNDDIIEYFKINPNGEGLIANGLMSWDSKKGIINLGIFTINNETFEVYSSPEDALSSLRLSSDNLIFRNGAYNFLSLNDQSISITSNRDVTFEVNNLGGHIGNNLISWKLSSNQLDFSGWETEKLDSQSFTGSLKNTNGYKLLEYSTSNSGFLQLGNIQFNTNELNEHLFQINSNDPLLIIESSVSTKLLYDGYSLSFIKNSNDDIEGKKVEITETSIAGYYAERDRMPLWMVDETGLMIRGTKYGKEFIGTESEWEAEEDKSQYTKAYII